MATPKRNGAIPGTYFLTSSTWQRREIFRSQRPCEIFVECLFNYREAGRFELQAFVLMPDHFHLILSPASGVTLERAIQYVKGGSAHAIGKELAFKLPVWQKGFSDHRLRDSDDFVSHLAYLEQNPVKRGLATTPQDYAWSSASGRFRMGAIPQRLKPLDSWATVGAPEGAP